MLSFFVYILLGLISLNPVEKPALTLQRPPVHPERELYDSFGLEGEIEFETFMIALEGFDKVHDRKKDLLTIIDFSKPSTEERLYILDFQNRELLLSSHVAHGKNSGDRYATSFSNEVGSFKSSLGFFMTENTYRGRNGYSLVLNGLEKGINDRAKERAIVVHGSDYADPKRIGPGGRLGRSLGCPALPRSVNNTVIDLIKGGSVLYIHAEDPEYFVSSTLCSPSFISGV